MSDGNMNHKRESDTGKRREETAQARKLFVVGLDGGTWDNLLPLVEQGLLPTFASLIEEGSWGPLRSTIPCLTPPAWGSFLTGASPGRHGVLDYAVTMDTEAAVFVTLKDLAIPALWDIFTHFGLRSAFLNVPFTYPPPALDGVFVPGPPVPPGKFMAFPPELTGEVLQRIPGYSPDLAPVEKDRFLESVYQATEKRASLTKWLMALEPWDFFMVTFIATDRLHHRMWHLHDVVSKYYQSLDEVLGDILRRVDSGAHILFLSDHGFTELKSKFFLNRWLANNGFLCARFVHHNKRNQSYLNPYARKRKTLGKLSRPRRLLRLLPGCGDLGWVIDLTRTKAFSSFGYFPGVYVNLKGRYEWGIVEPDDYEQVRNALVDSLSEIRAPSGEPLFCTVARREEMFAGPHVGRMPDIVCEMSSNSVALYPDLGYRHPHKIQKRRRGVHEMNGLFAVKGPGVKQGYRIDNISIHDLAPLILYLMKLPQLSSMDGVLHSEILETEYFGNCPPSVVSAEEIKCSREEYDLTEEEQEAFRRSLEALGYI